MPGKIVLLTAAWLSALAAPAGAYEAAPKPVVSTADECAILAAVAQGELTVRTEAGAIRLPEPRRDLEPAASRAERHAAYAEKLKGWDPKDVESLEQWVARDVAVYEDLGLSQARAAELAAADGAARPAYRLACDWRAHGISFDPDEAQPNQWLTFTRPLTTADGRLAVAWISYGYTPTFAREEACLLEKVDGAWRFKACRATLMS
ncbi:hypothetical protein [Caulobacter sp. 17J80-11]|uniref:hypothetical protein n=1 Tax=Caulobacter sp. 17J80-11 TaxID=2763502 RepID=UPI001653EA59|nr:hypothetical protein [Caulobacter sp. 17J80-11]MBC6982661.1 hypothetical protein [Caulobacter sp. 17J80-11]